jgi:hypothetical protein
MVLGLLTAIAACPAIIGTTEAVRQGQAQNAKEKHRGQKTNLVASCVKQSSQSDQINGGMVVLRNHKVGAKRSFFAMIEACAPLLTIPQLLALYRIPNR